MSKGIDVVFDKVEQSTSFVFTGARARGNGEKRQYPLQWTPEPGQIIHALIAEFDESQENRHRVLLVARTKEEIDKEREFAIFNWSNDEAVRHKYPISSKLRVGVPVRFRQVSVPWSK